MGGYYYSAPQTQWQGTTWIYLISGWLLWTWILGFHKMRGTNGFSRNLGLHNFKTKPLFINQGVVKVLTKYLILSGFHQTSGVLCTVQLYKMEEKRSGTSFGTSTKSLMWQLIRFSFCLLLDVQEKPICWTGKLQSQTIKQ